MTQRLSMTHMAPALNEAGMDESGVVASVRLVYRTVSLDGIVNRLRVLARIVAIAMRTFVACEFAPIER